jgi:hypothetical protein
MTPVNSKMIMLVMNIINAVSISMLLLDLAACLLNDKDASDGHKDHGVTVFYS